MLRGWSDIAYIACQQPLRAWILAVFPELFFSLYSKENGYEETEVFLADHAREDIWYQVSKPENGRRIELDCWARLFLLCRTRKGASFSHENVQQSDYRVVWARDNTADAMTEAAQPAKIEKSQRPVRRDLIARTMDIVRHVRASMRGELFVRTQLREIAKRPISSLL